MSIKFTAKNLEIDGETMKKFHSPYNMAKHLKYLLGMPTD